MMNIAMPEYAESLYVLGPIVVVVLVGLWMHFRFIVLLRGGLPRVLKGKVTAAFLAEVATVCAEDGIRRGWVCGAGRGKRTVLVFSWHFPRSTQQRLRNLWQIHA